MSQVQITLIDDGEAMARLRRYSVVSRGDGGFASCPSLRPIADGRGGGRRLVLRAERRLGVVV